MGNNKQEEPQEKPKAVASKTPAKKQQPVVNTRTSSRFKVSGKANPIRDAACLVGALGLMMYLAMGSEKNEVKQESTTERLVSKLQDIAQEAAGAVVPRRTEPCDLFLGDGIIPGWDLSYFAGKDYETGDVILRQAPDVPLIPIDGELYAPQHAFVIKFHPALHNAEGTLYATEENLDGPFELRASRPITAGEEIFVSFDKRFHNQRIFTFVPRSDDYQAAADILVDAIGTIDRRSKLTTGTVSSAPVFKLLQRTIRRAGNQRISLLIPDAIKTAQAYMANAPFKSLKNQTLLGLQQTATCVDDQHKSTEQRMVLPNGAKKDDVILSIPVLYVREATCSNEEHNVCHPYESRCYVTAGVDGLFCPLIPKHPEIRGTVQDANVYFEWRDPDHVSQFKSEDLEFGADSVLVWDMIAGRDIEAGEEVRARGAIAFQRLLLLTSNLLLLLQVLRKERQGLTDKYHFPDTLIPQNWKKYA